MNKIQIILKHLYVIGDMVKYEKLRMILCAIRLYHLFPPYNFRATIADLGS